MLVASLARTSIRKRTNVVLPGAAFAYAFAILVLAATGSLRRRSFDVPSAATIVLPSLLGFASAFSAAPNHNHNPLPKTKPSNRHRFETRSCPPPRFDDFSESLIGAWTIQEAGSDSNKNSNGAPSSSSSTAAAAAAAKVVVEGASFVADVEEVMRSCGGAVQGIREPANTASLSNGGEEGNETNTTHGISSNSSSRSSSSSSSSSTYLNRANDGFVFFDDGCYTMGPLSIGNNKDDQDDAAAFLSCLVLPEADPDGRKQRLVVSFGGGSGSSNTPELARAASEPILLSHTATMRTKRRFGDDHTNQHDQSSSEISPSGNADEANDDPASDDEETTTTTTVTIEEIKHIVRCRMPSEGQPWMLQRAKWETILPSLGAIGDADDTIDASADQQAQEDTNSVPAEDLLDEPFRWVVSEPAQDFYERLGITTSVASHEGTIVQCGFACPKSKTLRVLARQYQYKSDAGATGSDATAGAGASVLCGILRVEGTVGFGSTDARMGGDGQQ